MLGAAGGNSGAALAVMGIAAKMVNTIARARSADRVFLDVVFMMIFPFFFVRSL